MLREKRTDNRRSKISGGFDVCGRLARREMSCIKTAKRLKELQEAKLQRESMFFSFVNSRKPIRRKSGTLENEVGTLTHSNAENAHLLNDYFSLKFPEESSFIF